MLLMAFTPLVLAQQTPPSDVPADVPADSGAIPSLDTPAPGFAVGCQSLCGYQMPEASSTTTLKGSRRPPNSQQLSKLPRRLF
jgi:hypothetical protein